MQLDLNQLRELLAVFDQTDISELTLKSGDFELTLRKGTHLVERGTPTFEPPAGGSAPSGTPASPAPSALNSVASGAGSESGASGTSQGNAGANPPAPAPIVPPPNDKKWIDVISPMVGTFYRSPAPTEAPFVEVGDRIKVGQTVCIIEAMKLMNEIEAEVSGQVMEIAGQNGEPVEYGQVLLRINPE
ncbi:acetyl-CoA carboxylase biotin carboxyl carrier protein [Microcoleus sp. FACHB-672]|uniref:acetyl-CoA carboxylase biotin carboxyl carrier protein n=1 Tax=Microcoleus sp. FACHB-672 TaxID=2692825 RepID=UPI001684D113|nr:acetyl-CoA carboxylase biotin carboxyl carrier protein [Microcoleus sp. FACHB-672]MBD2041307.1 acetyl-CoA carboxylase biotin carboxyl carrier protein [Microcoleus sp. FACHB-672]